MMFLWPFTEVVLKQKERNNRCAEARYWRRTQHTQTHTHTNLTTDLMFREPNNYNKLLWLHGPALDQLLNTVALQSIQQTLTAVTDSQRVSITVHYWTVEMLLRTWNIRFQHVYSGQCAILSTLYNGYRSILSTVHGYCAKLPTHDWHWAIPSTEYLMDIAQYCPQNIQCFWQCTIKISCICLTQYIANNLNIKCRRSITPCNNIPSPTVQ